MPWLVQPAPEWILTLLASSTTFALADVLCDICITESHTIAIETAAVDDDDDDATDDDDTQQSTTRRNNSAHDGPTAESRLKAGPRRAHLRSLSAIALNTEGDGEYSQLKHSGFVDGDASISVSEALTKDAGHIGGDDDGGTLSGEQDAAVAGIVTILLLVMATIYYEVAPSSSGRATFHVSQLAWGPFTHVQFWFAMLGGAMAFLHYYFLLKAFEGAPSTVLLPLVQVASVSVLLGSSVIAIARHEQWIAPVHALAYLLMFVGGILPACAGQLSELVQPAFWRQSFVYCAILAELSLGLHDLMLSGCSYTATSRRPMIVDAPLSATTGGAAAIDSVEEVVESFEFFVWSRISFIGTFCAMYTLSPRLNAQLRDLLSGRIRGKYIALSAISEGLTVAGFYLASIAYGLFYQAGIVHAAEASMSQLFNLLVAYMLYRCFRLGRSSAVESMPAKLVSFVMVTVGLFLCTIDDRSPASAAGKASVVPGSSGVEGVGGGGAWYDPSAPVQLLPSGVSGVGGEVEPSWSGRAFQPVS